MSRVLRCKKYHEPQDKLDRGYLHERYSTKKSRCPGWLKDEVFRHHLLDGALVDPDAGKDSFGNPKRVWNAVSGWFFVGVSTNEQVPSYNCYPEVPASALLEELSRRAERSIEELIPQDSI